MTLDVKRLIMDRAVFEDELSKRTDFAIKGSYIILVPMYDTVQPLFALSLFRLVNTLNSRGIKFRLVSEVMTYLPIARETLSYRSFMEPGNWIIWLDSDVAFSPEAVLYLMEAAEKREYDMVSPVIYTRMSPHIPMVYQGKQPMQLPKFKEWVTADKVGFGCVIMSKEALETIPRPHFRVNFKKSGGIIGEDIFFFKKAKQYKLKLGVNLFVKFGHIGGVVSNEGPQTGTV
jgi:hypothetical protein